MNRLVKAAILMLGLVAVLTLVSCGGPTQTAKSGAADAGSSEKDKNADLAIGEVAEYDGWTVTVLKTEWVAPEFDPTGEMHQINVSYENNTDSAIPTDESDWELEDATGRPSLETTSKPQGLWAQQAVPREIAPGEKGVYSIFFVTPERDVAKVVYSPPKSLGDVREATWE